MFSKSSIIQIFLPGDLVLKQGDEGEKFNIIINGYVTVIRERKDISAKKFYEMSVKDDI